MVFFFEMEVDTILIAHKLSHFERKLITIIQHNTKRGHSPSLKELEIRTGHDQEDIKSVINDLINRGWLRLENGEIIVLRKLF